MTVFHVGDMFETTTEMHLYPARVWVSLVPIFLPLFSAAVFPPSVGVGQPQSVCEVSSGWDNEKTFPVGFRPWKSCQSLLAVGCAGGKELESSSSD